MLNVVFRIQLKSYIYNDGTFIIIRNYIIDISVTLNYYN